MTKIISVIAMLGIAVGACVTLYFFLKSSSSNLTGSNKSPNIIVIMADDMGWNDVSYHGSNQIPTPNIDALAYNGVIINKHYALLSCTPSRTALLTGNYPIRAGMQGIPLIIGEAHGIPLNFTLLPEYLRNLGYRTHLVGKWHLGYFADAYLPTSRGFDTFFGYYNGFIRYFTYIIDESTTGFLGYDLHREVNGKLMTDYTPKDVYATDLFTDEAENIIVNHNIEEPLYLHVAHAAPHRSSPGNNLEVRDTLEVNKTFSYISHYKRRLYAGMVSALDDSVGRIVQALNNKGALNDSIIVFMSDNGGLTAGPSANFGSNYPYRGLKHALLEGGVHTPALIWSSIIEKTSRIYENYFHITDWLPTLYHVAGGDVDDLGPIDGVNQWEAISRGIPGPRDSLLLNIDEKQNITGAIKGKFKYLTGTIEDLGSYFGENVDDGDPSAPSYNVTSIMYSTTALAIGNSTKNNGTVDAEKMLQLRRDNKIVCTRELVTTNCTISCLFDIEVDPCETTDVSADNPMVVQELQDFIAGYWNELVPQRQKFIDPRAFPEYEGGPWLPWLNVDGEYLPHNVPVIFGNWTRKTQDNVNSFSSIVKRLSSILG